MTGIYQRLAQTVTLNIDYSGPAKNILKLTEGNEKQRDIFCL